MSDIVITKQCSLSTVASKYQDKVYWCKGNFTETLSEKLKAPLHHLYPQEKRKGGLNKILLERQLEENDDKLEIWKRFKISKPPSSDLVVWTEKFRSIYLIRTVVRNAYGINRSKQEVCFIARAY